MSELLHAGWMRLRRSKLLWLCCAGLAAITAGMIAWRWNDLQRSSPPLADNNLTGVYSDFDLFFFHAAASAVLLSCAVCVWELGAEYQDGAMRNKLSVGKRRRDVYLSALALTVLTALLLCLAVYIPGVIALLLTTGGFAMGWGEALLQMAGLTAASAAFASLFTLLCLNITNRAASAIAAIALTLALMLGGAVLNGRLDEPPEYTGFVMTVNGVPTPSSYPNPLYIPEGPVRDTVRFFADLLPGGQVSEYANASAADPLRLMAYDGLFIILVTGLGVHIFRRKDLK